TALPDPPRPVASHEDGSHMLQVVMPVQIAPHRGPQLLGVLQPAEVLRTYQLPTAIWPVPPPPMHVHQSRLPTSPVLSGHMVFVGLDEQGLPPPLRARGFALVGDTGLPQGRQHRLRRHMPRFLLRPSAALAIRLLHGP